MEQDGLSVREADDPRAVQRVLPIDDFSANIRTAAMIALPVYLAFFRLENAVREIISKRMHKHPSWPLAR